MNKIFSLITCAVLLLSACTTTEYQAETEYNHEYNFANLSSFTLQPDTRLAKSLLGDNDKKALAKALKKSIEQQGLITSNNPEVLFQYYLVTANKEKINTTSQYAYDECERCGSSIGAHASTREYVEGTLVVYAVDKTSDKIVWRSSYTRPIRNFAMKEDKLAALQVVTDAIFTDWPKK